MYLTRILSLLLLALSLSTAATAQDDSRYLAGAVPMEDGKVVFRHTFQAPGLTTADLLQRLQAWAGQRFRTDEESGNQGRVLYTNADLGQLVCQGCEYMVFSDRSLSLDRARVYFRTTFRLRPGQADMELTHIYYIYGFKDEKYTAEDWITDETALNKSRTKLAYSSKKFRVKTIDLVDALQAEVQTALDVRPTRPAEPVVAICPPHPSEPGDMSESATKVDASEAPEGFTAIAPTRIPGNIVKMLSQDWMLITAGSGSEANAMTASWGGLGHLYERPVAFCFVSPERHTYRLMEKADTYTLTFYTEAYRDALQYCGTHSGRDGQKWQAAGLTPMAVPGGGTATREAWLIIECRKLVSQSLTPEALADESLRDRWTGRPMHKLYIGEITHVWIK